MKLKAALNEETVNRLPLRKAIAVSPDTVISEAVTLMKQEELGCTVIVNTDNRPVGLFSERGVIEALINNASPKATSVQEFAEPTFHTVKTSDSISRVWDVIVHQSSRFVCVTDDEGNLAGLTGQRGLAEYVSEYYPGQIMVQRLGGKPWAQQREGA